MKKRLMVLLLAAAVVFAMCGCGSSDSGSQEEQAPENSVSTGSTSSDLDTVAEYYQFDLDGKSYALPCALGEFKANGWYVDEIENGVAMDPQTWTIIYVYTDSSMTELAFRADVINIEEESKPIEECLVQTLAINDSGACKSSLTMKKAGVKIDMSSETAAESTIEALKAAYGTDETCYSESSGDPTVYGWRFSKLVEDQEDTYVMGMEEGTYISKDEFKIEFAGRVQ